MFSRHWFSLYPPKLLLILLRAETIQKNRQTFREIYGKLPSELEPEWLNSLASGNK